MHLTRSKASPGEAWRRCCLTILVAAVGIMTGGAARGAQQTIAWLEPDDVEDVTACCTGEVAAPVATQADSRVRSNPGALDRQTAATVKQAAGADPDAPIGRDVSGVTPGEVQERAPALRHVFDGITQSRADFDAFPPDTQIAAGPDVLLHAVNINGQLFRKDGSLVAEQRFSVFFLESGLGLFDPKVHYDPFSKRFFLVLLRVAGTTSEAFVAVSRSSNPDSFLDEDWCKYRFNTNQGSDWGDYPGLGINERWLAITTNNFTQAGAFDRVRLFAIDKTKLADNAAGCPGLRVSKFNVRNDASGRQVFSLQMGQHYENSGLADNPLYGVASRFAGGSEYALFTLRAHRRRADGKPRLRSTMIEAEQRYTFPPPATQRGGIVELENGGNRIMQQAIFRNGRFWFAHTTGCSVAGSAANTACVRVVAVEVDADGAVRRVFEDTFGAPDEFFFWPGIAINGRGDIVATFQRSGPDLLLGIGYNGMRRGARRFGQAARVGFDAARPAAEGECTLENIAGSGNNQRARTGDYIGMAADPSTNDFWLAGEVGDRRDAFICQWASKIARVRY